MQAKAPAFAARLLIGAIAWWHPMILGGVPVF
jgi:hypothetical protein